LVSIFDWAGSQEPGQHRAGILVVISEFKGDCQVRGRITITIGNVYLVGALANGCINPLRATFPSSIDALDIVTRLSYLVSIHDQALAHTDVSLIA
jgi:hypothetical protein